MGFCQGQRAEKQRERGMGWGMFCRIKSILKSRNFLFIIFNIRVFFFFLKEEFNNFKRLLIVFPAVI